MSAGYSPMAVLSLAAQRDKQKLASGDAWILLLDLVWQGEHFRLARNVDAITFDAGDGAGPQVYQPFNFDFTVDEGAAGQLPTMVLRASNTMRILQGVIEQYAGAVGAVANLYVYNTANPSGEADLAISSTVTRTVCTNSIVTLNLSAPSPIRQLFPRFLYRANFCMWVSKYKGPQCGYTGTLTNCDGTYSGTNGCMAHNNATRFGAFPGIGTNGVVIAAQQ
jgi:phage-related protein